MAFWAPKNYLATQRLVQRDIQLASPDGQDSHDEKIHYLDAWMASKKSIHRVESQTCLKVHQQQQQQKGGGERQSFGRWAGRPPLCKFVSH